jgi:NNP family nitrate/nitrite transporter-like MFS transporter
MSETETPPQPTGADWLQEWEPETETFWNATGKSVAWRTLWITTFNLTLAFVAWFVVSAALVRLPNIGFELDKGKLFWLAAMPGLSAGTLRLLHMFLIPIYGTRKVVTVSTLLLIIPLTGWGFAVQNPHTGIETLMILAFLAGLGGGNFSSFMPSTSLFFPKRMQGTALAVQAGVGNFGVSLVQFVTPWIIGFALLGSTLGASQTFTKEAVSKPIWLQNAFFLWIPFCLVGALLAWTMLKSVPVRATFREQSDIFTEKHTWFMTSLYMMTFGSFSGFSAMFPLMINNLFGSFPNAPDPLKYAFLGPLIGSAARVLSGPISDKLGGAKVTMFAGVGLLACGIFVTTTTSPTSAADFPPFLWAMLGLFLFSGIGNASTFKQIPMIFPPRQASGVIGYTAAIAAYGPFLMGVLIGISVNLTGHSNMFFHGIAVFYFINLLLNWHYYARKGAEKPC